MPLTSFSKLVRSDCQLTGHGTIQISAKVAKLADAPDLGSGGAIHGGSSPPFRTMFFRSVTIGCGQIKGVVAARVVRRHSCHDQLDSLFSSSRNRCGLSSARLTLSSSEPQCTCVQPASGPCDTASAGGKSQHQVSDSQAGDNLRRWVN